MNKIPWQDIKRDYTLGIEEHGKRIYPSLRQLADKYKTPFQTIGNRCTKEDWLSERQIISNKIRQTKTKKVIEEISDTGVEFDLKCFEDAKTNREKIQNLIKEKTEPKEIALLISSLKTNQSYAKEALGETSTEKETIIISPDFVPENDKHNE